MIESVLIPQDRKKVLTKEVMDHIGNKLNLNVSRKDNTVYIDGEGLELFQAKSIIKAIGRGFSPERAYRLLDLDETLDVVELKKLGERRALTIKSRIIGTNGKTRKKLEEYSGASISIYGNTIALIGTFEQIQSAKEAVMMFIKGVKHTTVYKFLEQVRK
jgi:ribosomal RNA assembly protein